MLVDFFNVPVCLLVGCLTTQQHASVSKGGICSDNLTCCHTEIEVADPTFYLTQSQYTDTGPTSPSTDPITPGAWQGSHWSANFEVTGMTRSTPKKSRRKRDSNPGSSALEADALTTRPTRRSSVPETCLCIRGGPYPKRVADQTLLSHPPTASWAECLRRPPQERKTSGVRIQLTTGFFWSSHTSDLKIGTPVATLPGAWRFKVSAETGRPGVSIL